MANTPEFQKIITLGPQLRTAFQNNLIPLSESFLRAGLISDDNDAEIRDARSQTGPHRAAKLLELIRNRVKLSSANYHTFVEEFQEVTAGQSAYQQLVDELNSIRGKKTTSQKSNISEAQLQLKSSAGTGQRFCDKDHAKIFDKLKTHAHMWREIGRSLHFSEEEMDVIENSHRLFLQAPGSFLTQLLTQWLQWAPGDGRQSTGYATRESLHAALMHANLGGLAKKFESDTDLPQMDDAELLLQPQPPNDGEERSHDYKTSERRVGMDSTGGYSFNSSHDHKRLFWCVDCPLPEQNVQCRGVSGTDHQPLKASLRFNLLWHKDELYVKFVNNIPREWTYKRGGLNHEMIFNWASLWNKKGGNIPKLTEVEGQTPADIRVKFTESEGSYSYIGESAQDVNGDERTMCLNLSKGGDEYKKYVVIHEFGHALGLEHEHQRGDLWKLIEPYVSISAMKNDDTIKGNEQYFEDMKFFNAPERRTSKYDPGSVMHYWFRSDWLKEDYNSEEKVKRNSKLNEDERHALLGILKRSKGICVVTPSEEDYEFLEKTYKEKKSTQSGEGKVPTEPPVEGGHAPPIPNNGQSWGRYLCYGTTIILIPLLAFGVAIYARSSYI